MFLRFPCQSCQAKLRVEAKLAGMRVRCPKCGMQTSVPANNTIGQIAEPVSLAEQAKQAAIGKALDTSAIHPYEVGDIVEPYRHFDVKEFIPGAKADKKGTKWKVLEITDDYVHLELVEGRYEWGFDGIAYKFPGYSSKFTASDNYKRQFPDRKKNQQILEEYRKVD